MEKNAKTWEFHGISNTIIIQHWWHGDVWNGWWRDETRSESWKADQLTSTYLNLMHWWSLLTFTWFGRNHCTTWIQMNYLVNLVHSIHFFHSFFQSSPFPPGFWLAIDRWSSTWWTTQMTTSSLSANRERRVGMEPGRRDFSRPGKTLTKKRWKLTMLLPSGKLT